MTPATCTRVKCQRYQQLKKDNSDWCVLKLLIDQDGKETARCVSVFSVGEKDCKRMRKTSPDFDPAAKQSQKE